MAPPFELDDVVKGQIPAQASGRRLGARKGKKQDKDTGPKGPGFEKTRFVMDIEIYDEDSGQPVTADFDPKLELRVRYNQGDVRAAGGLENLKLGFWINQEWMPFTDKHGFRLEQGPGETGWGIVELERFGDPPVAWGK